MDEAAQAGGAQMICVYTGAGLVGDCAKMESVVQVSPEPL